MRNIPLIISDRLRESMARRPSLKELVARKMKERGIVSARELAARATAKGHPISNTSINYIASGRTTDPGYQTIVAIAVALHEPPALFFAELLGDKLEDPNFKAGQFATLAEIYKAMTPTQRAKAEPHIEGLTLQLLHIKNQK